MDRRNGEASSHFGAGYFQPELAQSGCISCDSLGDFYQNQPGQTACVACAVNSQRYNGVLSAGNKSSCQCKEGAPPSAAPRPHWELDGSARHSSSEQSMDCACSLCRLLQWRWWARRGALPLTVCCLSPAHGDSRDLVCFVAE